MLHVQFEIPNPAYLIRHLCYSLAIFAAGKPLRHACSRLTLQAMLAMYEGAFCLDCLPWAAWVPSALLLLHCNFATKYFAVEPTCIGAEASNHTLRVASWGESEGR